MSRLLLLSILTAAKQGQVSLQSHYISLGPPVAIAAEASENLFIVSQIGNGEKPSIRVTRADSSGNVTATFEFRAGRETRSAAVECARQEASDRV